GGHAAAVISLTASPEKAVLIDRDAQAAAELKRAFRDAETINQDFLTASADLADQGRRFDLILADLGVSSPHLEDAPRGFSIKKSGDLDMRMDQGQQLTAGRILNGASETELTKIFREYGEEPKARAIAKKI